MRPFQKWAALFCTLTLVVALGASPVPAAAQSVDIDAATKMLNRFGIVVGDSNGFRLADPITRAEMIKIMVAAAGKDSEGALLTGAASFADMRNHWASGYVALAQRLNYTTGYPDGSFRPDAKVTYAEAITFIARVAGLQPSPGEVWPANYLAAASAAGITPATFDLALIQNNPAVRGGVFSLANNAFFKVKDNQGKNLYQRVFDTQPPEVVLDTLPTSTQETRITVSGRIQGGVSLTVGGEPIPLAADGRFSVGVSLQPGSNTVNVAATDDVGNVAARTVTISRSAGAVATIEAPDALALRVGETKALSVVAKDQSGVVVTDASLSAEGAEGLGIYNPAASTFTAGDQVGTGLLTLRAGTVSKTVRLTVTAGDPVSIRVSASKSVAGVGEMVQISATVTDAAGHPVQGPGVNYSVSGSDALVGPTSGQFIAARAGVFTATATAGNLSGSVQIAVYGEVAGLKVTSPETLVANNTSKAELVINAVDTYGSVVGNAKNTVTLAISSDAATLLDADGNELAEVTLDSGEAKVYLQADVALWGALVKVTATDETDTDLEATAEVEMLQQEATALKVKSRDAYLAANDDTGRATITYIVVDQAGAEMLDGAWDIRWSISGPAKQEGTSDTSGTIVYVSESGGVDLALASVRGEVGQVKVSAGVDGVGSAETTLQATVAGVASRVQVKGDSESPSVSDDPDDKGVELTVTVTDSKGVPVRYTGTVLLDFSNGLTAATGGALSDEDGDGTSDRITLDFNDENRQVFFVAHTTAGKNTITASGGTLAKTSTTVNWLPASPAKVAFDREVMEMIFSVEDPKGTLVLQLYDEWDNKATSAGKTIAVEGLLDGERSDEVTIDGTGKVKEITTDQSGRAVLKVATRPYPGSNYSVRIGDTPAGITPVAGSDEVTIDLAISVASRVEVDLQDSSDRSIAAAAAGDAVKVLVTLKDKFGEARTGLSAFLHLVVDDGVWSVSDDGSTDTAAAIKTDTDGSWSDHGDGTYSVILYPGKVGRAAARVRIDLNGTYSEGSDSLRTGAGPDRMLVIEQAQTVGGMPQVTVKPGQPKPFTLRVSDSWGNLKSGSQSYTAAFSTGATSVVVRQSASGSDITTAEVRGGTTIYLLVPSGGSGGLITVREDVGALDSWDVEVVVED